MKVLVLKSVYSDGSAYGGFIWPKSGKVICPDWNPAPKYGRGLHGLLWGEGIGGLLNRSKNARWLVLEVESEKIIDLAGKVKFPECEIVYCGGRDVAIRMILERNPVAACCFAKKVVGDFGKVIVGDYGEAIVGHGGQATAGERGQATAGEYGRATVGHDGKAIVGDYGKATAGSGGQATAGYGGIAAAEHGGTATVGNNGQATVGDGGTAIVGNDGQATAGEYGKAQCGEGGWIEIKYWIDNRFRVLVGYAGEEIEANVMYKVQDGKFVKAEQ